MIKESRKFDVISIGELNADLIFTGLEEGPVLNREILASGYKKTMGSSTALCTANMTKLGLKTAFCSKVGNDEMGRFVLEQLEKRNIDSSFCIYEDGAETGVTLSLNWSGDRAMVTVLGVIKTFSLKDFDINIINSAKHIHVGSFFLQEALRADLCTIFKTAHERGITTSLDTGWDNSENWDYGIQSVLEYTDLFFPNETEAIHIAKAKTLADAVNRLEKMCKNTVAIKRGKDGAYCLSGGKRYAIKAINSVKVIDTTGAGDSFNAGFIYGFINGLPIHECLEYGNASGGISVGSVGGSDADLNIDKVLEIIKKHGKSFILNQ